MDRVRLRPLHQRRGIGLRLNEEEKAIADGARGEAARAALEILTQTGDLFGAETMIPICQVHDDAVLNIGPAVTEFVERMVRLGGRVAVPTSLNAADYDLERPERLRADEDDIQACRRLSRAHLDLGAAPTWTCAPYQTGFVPRFGTHIAWAESNATAFANSILGARTNRYAGLLDICAALVGRAPYFGLHRPENRRAELLVTLDGFSREDLARDDLYPLLGYVYGGLAGDAVGALAGLEPGVATDSLKAFTAAAASSGSVGMFHLIGLTPEAPDRRTCLHGRPPKNEASITPAMIDQARAMLWTAGDDRPDLIVLGCPHFSFAEFSHLIRLLGDRKVHPEVEMWVFTNRQVRDWLETAGLERELEGRGVRIFCDGCPLCYPHHNWNFRTALTNSGKFAAYGQAQTGHRIAISDLARCVDSAVEGRIVSGPDFLRKGGSGLA